MARRRFVVFLCLMLLIPNALFLLERPTPTATPPTPTDTSQDWGRPQRVQQITKFLLTPTFPIHALWITALAVLSIVAVADILLKLVFTCCTLGVEAVTGYRKTRCAYIIAFVVQCSFHTFLCHTLPSRNFLSILCFGLICLC